MRTYLLAFPLDTASTMSSIFRLISRKECFWLMLRQMIVLESESLQFSSFSPSKIVHSHSESWVRKFYYASWSFTTLIAVLRSTGLIKGFLAHSFFGRFRVIKLQLWGKTACVAWPEFRFSWPSWKRTVSITTTLSQRILTIRSICW